MTGGASPTAIILHDEVGLDYHLVASFGGRGASVWGISHDAAWCKIEISTHYKNEASPLQSEHVVLSVLYSFCKLALALGVVSGLYSSTSPL